MLLTYLKLKSTLSIRESYRNEDMDKALESKKWLVENHPNLMNHIMAWVIYESIDMN